MYGAVEIDDEVRRVKITMEEHRDKGNHMYDYRVTKIDLPISGSATTNALGKPIIFGANLLQGIEKSYDPGKKLLSESEKNAKSIGKGGVRFSTVEQAETGNFKNWFGDWKNDPDHASKIVGKDGRPLVVYHGGGFGQSDDFYDTYTWDNEGAGGWFTPNRDYAKTYTTRYDDNLEDLPPIEVYLNIRNPFEMGNVERLIIEDDKPTPVLHEIAQKSL